MFIQSNLSNVTFQGNIEIGSHKAGGHLIISRQEQAILSEMIIMSSNIKAGTSYTL
jgi:hypothetical protein